MMNIDGWRYYNHAAMPSTAPHVEANLEPIKDGTIWKISPGKTFCARWVSDYDCETETEWWYVIKDSMFDISQLKAKRRYEINKGKKNFYVHEIDPKEFKEEIYNIQVESYLSYPEKYRPNVNKDTLFTEIDKWKYYQFLGAFSKENNSLCGYAWLNRDNKYIYYAFHKVIPFCEKSGINAAIVAEVLESHENELKNGCYICDGSRSISHETHFQDYLEKYFGFRKAYCKLHITYPPFIRIFIHIIYPFRKLLQKMDGISIIHNVNGVLRMESIARGV